MKEIPKDKLVELADAHIARFGRLVVLAEEENHPGIRTSECRVYLNLWTDAKRRLLTGQELDPSQRDEIQDAIECGDYDELLGLGGDDGPADAF